MQLSQQAKPQWIASQQNSNQDKGHSGINQKQKLHAIEILSAEKTVLKLGLLGHLLGQK